MTVELKIPDIQRWDKLDSKCKNQYGILLDRILFDKLFSLLGLEKILLEIKAEGTDVIIVISYNGNELKKNIMLKHDPKENTLMYEIRELVFTKNYGFKMTKTALKELKTILENGIDVYFKPFSAIFCTYKFEVISRQNMALMVEAYNIKGVILESSGYFEKITIEFIFETLPDETIRINYKVWGKYGSGIILPPAAADYYDMDPEYGAQLERFVKKFGDRIETLITQ